MNKVMELTSNGFELNPDNSIIEQVCKSICRNNTFCPNIDRVIFNLDTYRGEKSHRTEYTLATTVFFVDGSKTTVKNSVHDKIDIIKEKVKLSDGSEIEVDSPSHDSKEIGLVYAIVKRIVGEPDEKGTVSGGFASFINKTLKKAFNQPVEMAKIEAEEKIRKTKKSQLKGQAKTKHPSLRECVKSLSEVVEKLAGQIMDVNKTKKTK